MLDNIAPNRHAVHPFDLNYGTDTGGYLRPDEIREGAINDAMSNGYSAVAPSVFREACQRWRETLPTSAGRVEAYTFVDVGAGKGRCLLLAAELPFRKVIGVELNSDLAFIAQRNVAHWKRLARAYSTIRVLQEDAMQFRWPRPPLLVFLNNPFECTLVKRLAEKLANLATQGPSLIDLIYVNPGCSDTLIRSGVFQPQWDTPIQMDEADRRADPYGATSDRVAAFRYVVNENEKFS